jgi:hypothetical protein
VDRHQVRIKKAKQALEYLRYFHNANQETHQDYDIEYHTMFLYSTEGARLLRPKITQIYLPSANPMQTHLELWPIAEVIVQHVQAPTK